MSGVDFNKTRGFRSMIVNNKLTVLYLVLQDGTVQMIDLKYNKTIYLNCYLYVD